ncbi:DUF3951 domain-containing protein [Paenibacillus silviterrae]|uniref:DUF3951 domain-containing protein n=1 Tax=Paenibacillus silviterrae TaxID=3242194 RepID=UPI0025426E27|nr:DUF3951 domain-containing protein [Paenibacillus chinjuensis]
MDIFIVFTLGFSGCIILLVSIIAIKVITKKKLPDNNYTPFDYITAQTNIEFHQEKEGKEEETDKGDDKYKNRKKTKRLN